MDKFDKVTFSTSIIPRFRDVDAFGHVNNAVYVTYLEIARVDWFVHTGLRRQPSDLELIIARVEVDYRRPIEMGDEIEVGIWVSHIGNKSWTFDYIIREKTTKEIKAEAKTVQVTYDFKSKETKLIPDMLLDILQEYNGMQALEQRTETK